MIRHDTAPPKLVAATWFKVSDVLHYLDLQVTSGASDGDFEILDFKAETVLRREGSRLVPMASF